jgi:Tfp pilus assembly protein PilN
MIDINLIATRRAQRQRAIALMRLAFYGLLGLGVVLVLLYFWMTFEINYVQARIQDAEASLQDPTVQENIKQINTLDSQIAILGPKVKVLKKVHDSESRWIEVVRDIGAAVPANVGITAFTSRRVDRGQQISLSGAAASQSLIGAYMLAVQSDAWAGPLQLVQADTSRSAKNSNLVNFELTIPLKEPIGVESLTKVSSDSAEQSGDANDKSK